MRCPHCGEEVETNPRSMCANCNHPREDHYALSGAWMGDQFGCPEYNGREMTETEKKDRAAAKKRREV